jgi:type VI secretion system Hcp family effector
MSDIIYLSITGEQQGHISAGCGSTASIGNRWQKGHEDEIFSFSLASCMTSTGKGIHLQGLRFEKLIDKSSPLLMNAINNNEQLFMEFYFHRINSFGRWDKYYSIQLRGAFLSDINMRVELNSLDTETVTVNYEYILSKHLIAKTEFSYLAFPEHYNRLFVPRRPNTSSHLKTLNSKAVGRLLAAGGVYNGNIQGFRDTAEKLGGDAVKGYDQVLNEKTAGTVIAAASVLLARRVNTFEKTYEINSYLGQTRGNAVLLKDIKLVNINYIKRSQKDALVLRKEFNRKAKKSFLEDLSISQEAKNHFSPEVIARMREGGVPDEWQVHHKLPLDDGGTNAPDNLILIKNEPFHKALTNFQLKVTKGMRAGDQKIISWVIPQGKIYPKQ